MKLFSLPFLAIGFGTILVAGGIVYAVSGSSNKMTVSSPNSAAYDASATTSGVGANDASPGTMNDQGSASSPNGQRGQHMRQMFAQLGLTDAQKQQIQQIRQTVTDRQQRREQIMSVLTPDQRAKLEQLRAEHKGGLGPHPGAGPGTGAPASPPLKTN